MEVRGQTSSRKTGCDWLGGSRVLEPVQLFREDECFVPPVNPTRQPFVSPAATKLLPYRPHAPLAHCCYCWNVAAITATVHIIDSTDVAHRILADTLVLASATCKSGWKGICSYVLRCLFRCATYLFNFKPLFVSLSIMLTRHFITNFEFTGISVRWKFGYACQACQREENGGIE